MKSTCSFYGRFFPAKQTKQARKTQRNIVPIRFLTSNEFHQPDNVSVEEKTTGFVVDIFSLPDF